MENRSKTNSQAFAEYFDLVASSKSAKWDYETCRLLNQFRQFIGEYPPTIELFAKFFQRYSNLSLSTRARYYYVFSALFSWYSGQKLPFKIKAPKPLSQHVSDEDVAKLLAVMRNKKSHKSTIDRDVLLVETAYHTGLRRAEISNLKVGDLEISSETPRLLVRQGKGGKDRVVYLNNYIRERLAAFVRGLDAGDSVFGLAPKSISLKIGDWARKAGVSLHPHSLRHKFATDILDRGGNIRAVQQLLRHESLGTTETYLAVTNDALKDTVNLLDNGRQNMGHGSGDADAGKEVEPVGSAKESKNSVTQHIPASPNVDASGSRGDPLIAALQLTLDPINLCQALEPEKVEELQLAGLPLIDKAVAGRLLGLSKNHAQNTR